MRVAFDRDCYRQARDVARIREDVDAKSRGVAAVALGPYAEPVGAPEDFLLDRIQRRVGIWRSELTEERPLRQDGSLLEVAPDPDAGDERRARVGPGRPYALEDPVLDAFHPFGRREHLVLRAVLAPAALGHDLYRHSRPRHHLEMDDGGRVIARVHPIDRRAHDRGAEIALPVALADPFVDGIGQGTAGDVDLLPQLHEADDRPRVLAVRELLGPREVGVVLQDLENVLAGRRPLGLERLVEGPEHVGLEGIVRLHAELLDRIGDGARVDVAHGSFVSVSRQPARRRPPPSWPSPAAERLPCGSPASTSARTDP